MRLPDAALPWRGRCDPAASSSGPCAAALHLLLIGESTVAGVGVDTQQQALCGQLAQQMADTWLQPVHWQACGRNGATAAVCRQQLLPGLEQRHWDLVVIVLGVNDTTRLTPRWRWRGELEGLLEHFSARTPQVLFTAVPPLGRFRAVPQPLRSWLGLRAGLLDRDLRRCCASRRALHAPMALSVEAGHLARDGYHPSVIGYQRWAAGILACLIQSGWSASGKLPSGSST